MPEHTADDGPDLPAGRVGPWLAGLAAALAGTADADVPCGGCSGCCTSSQFVLIGPDEAAARARIPAELRFPAPRSSAGHEVMGYDQHGHCPMLIDGRCSIYEHRPRTCRTYDCRVFTAAGIAPDVDQPAIADRVRRWRFDVVDDEDRILLDAVRAASAWVARHELPADVAPVRALHHAVLAVELHGLFREGEPEPDAVLVALRRRRPD